MLQTVILGCILGKLKPDVLGLGLHRECDRIVTFVVYIVSLFQLLSERNIQVIQCIYQRDPCRHRTIFWKDWRVGRSFEADNHHIYDENYNWPTVTNALSFYLGLTYSVANVEVLSSEDRVTFIKRYSRERSIRTTPLHGRSVLHGLQIIKLRNELTAIKGRLWPSLTSEMWHAGPCLKAWESV